VNLSTYLYEDFDVSLAQSLEAGWPAIISDWGGHRDVESSVSVMKIHPAMIGHAHELPELTKLRARSLAAHIAAGLKSKPVGKFVTKKPVKHKSFAGPLAITTSEIDSVRRSFSRKLGSGAVTLQRRGLDGYSYEKGAERFFASYRAGFSAPYEGGGAAVLVNDLHTTNEKKVASIPKIVDGVLKDRRLLSSAIVFIPTNEVLQPLHASVIHRAKEILVPFESKHLRPLLDHWLKDLEIPARIFTIAAPAGKLSFKELKARS